MKNLILFIAFLGMTNSLTKAQSLETVEAKYRGKPIIQMTLNNKKTWVLLDTGSEFTVFDSGAKDKFDFFVHQSSEQNLNVSGFGSSNNRLMESSGAQLRFGHVQLKGQTYAFDLSTVVKSIQLRTGKRITAIVGTHMMRSYGFVIDMRNSTASIHVKPKKKRKQLCIDSDEIIVAKNTNLNQ